MYTLQRWLVPCKLPQAQGMPACRRRCLLLMSKQAHACYFLPLPLPPAFAPGLDALPTAPLWVFMAPPFCLPPEPRLMAANL